MIGSVGSTCRSWQKRSTPPTWMLSPSLSAAARGSVVGAAAAQRACAPLGPGRSAAAHRGEPGRTLVRIEECGNLSRVDARSRRSCAHAFLKKGVDRVLERPVVPLEQHNTARLAAQRVRAADEHP
eukprot:5734275-Prymnesium_polylepis.1